MPTGACGVDCDVCKLKLAGICSTCGGGRSAEAELKLEAQKRLLGQPCPVLACAKMNRVDYCMRDCASFPCDNFAMGPYPFSRSFLEMQKRRRKQKPPARGPQGGVFTVPSEYWERFGLLDKEKLGGVSLAKAGPDGTVVVPHLGREILVDPGQRRIMDKEENGEWKRLDYPLLELMTLVYLLNVTDEPVYNHMISVSELKDAHFFRGPHALQTAPLLERYGQDPAGFRIVAEKLGGRKIDMADTAFKFLPFPKAPLYYLMWEGDEEFRPNMNILFDKSIERHLPADAIWGVVRLVSDELLLQG